MILSHKTIRMYVLSYVVHRSDENLLQPVIEGVVNVVYLFQIGGTRSARYRLNCLIRIKLNYKSKNYSIQIKSNNNIYDYLFVPFVG